MSVYGASGLVVGSNAICEKSVEIASAVASSNGKWSFFNTAIEVSAALTVTLTAATVRPDESRTGAN